MVKVNIKPLSINECFKGQRFKTNKYKKYELDLSLLLPAMEIPKENLCVNIVFGFSSSLSDVDNCVKPFLDILQKKYHFNDKQIFELHVIKTLVPKGKEHVTFSII